MIMDGQVACLNYVADYLKKGAQGFAAKNPTDSHLLAKAIRGTLGNSGNVKETSIAAGAFSGGMLKIYHDRAELLGIRVMTDTGYGRTLKVLRTLSVLRNDRYIAMSLSELAEAAGFESQNSLTGCIRRFRNNCSERLQRSHQVVCGRDDVLLRNEQGYQLASWIKVQIMDGGNCTANGTTRDTGAKQNGTAIGIGAKTDGTAVDVDLSLNDRQRWVLSEIENGERLQRSMLEEHFEVSPRTAKRDLTQLRDRNLIVWVRDGSGGYYRTDSSPESAA